MRRRRRRRHWDRLLAVLFVGLLAVPLVGGLAGGRSDEPEKPTADFEWTVRNVIAAPIERGRAFNKAFFSRTALVELHGRLKYSLLGVSPSSRVQPGKDGWLFLADEGAMDTYRNLAPLSGPELRRWVDALTARAAFCREREAHYLFTVSPNKHTIYGEHVPAGFRKAGPVSRLDQLASAVRAEAPGVTFVDVRESLLRAKTSERIYYRTDTHWNWLGGYVAYLDLVSALGQELPVSPDAGLDEIELEWKTFPGGDLAKLMGLSDVLEERAPSLIEGSGREASMGEEDAAAIHFRDLRHEGRIVTHCPEAEIESAVVFHDSFGKGLIPYLATQFRRTVFVWSNEFRPEVVAEEEPTVVIQQIVERRLATWFPEPDETRATERGR